MNIRSPHRPLSVRPAAAGQRGQRGQRGVTLIEVLVTMALLGIGLLGLAGLQLRGVQVNQGSTYRSQAAILAEDLADRMRVDAANVAAHKYDGPWSASLTGSGNVATLLSDWVYRLGGLPSGCVSVDSTSNAPEIQIQVYWDDTRATRSADASQAAAAISCAGKGSGTGSFGSYVLTTELVN